MLLLVFLKDAEYRAQREYRFAVWAEDDPAEDVVDLDVSPALVDAMWKPRHEPEGSGFVSAGAEGWSAVEGPAEGRSSSAEARVEALPASVGASNPTVPPRRYEVERLPGDLREDATAAKAVEAVREAVGRTDAAGRPAAAAAAWHAEPIVRFFCATFGDRITGVRVSEDGFVVITAELAGNGPVEASITVGPDGAAACMISAGGGHFASTAPDARSFEEVLKERLAEVGVRGQDSES